MNLREVRSQIELFHPLLYIIQVLNRKKNIRNEKGRKGLKFFSVRIKEIDKDQNLKKRVNKNEGKSH